ncbi:MAG TPA: DUF2795 domain-containing protein [Deltaproteobacteria bacterium]|jgi:hypothetical protein|nr:DUF2795 domain-containing protein [Deltaproteobacteria bacterium]HOI06693.1 DUF2795 domain-containing protein [Deltaproteobacteria bacterium]
MVSTGELQQYLHGIHYPADKDDLMKTARANKAPQDVVDLIKRLPDQSYPSPADVNKAVGKI